MTALPVNAGSKFFIGGAVADALLHLEPGLTPSDFAGETWLEVEGLEDLGALRAVGDPVKRGDSRYGPTRVTRTKGSRWVDTHTLGFTLAAHLPGQAALFAAEASDDSFAFRIVLADAPRGGTPSERLFVATVGALAEVFGAPEDQPRLAAELWVNSNVVRVNAAEG